MQVINFKGGGNFCKHYTYKA